MNDFFDIKSPEYAREHYKWQYAQDHYTSEVVDGADKDDQSPSKIERYLIQRSQGESDDAFNERKLLADYLPLFATAIDSIAGMAFNAGVSREWTDESGLGLGDVDNKESIAWRLFHNADGAGTNWDTVFKINAIDMMINKVTWCLVDGATEEYSNARIKLVNPLDVVDWIEDEGRLVQVRIDETIWERESVFDDTKDTDYQLVYDLEGWSRYERNVKTDDSGKIVDVSIEEVERQEYAYYDRTGRRVLPVVRTELPLRRNIGYMLARKNNIIFNKESDRDHLLRVANFPKLGVVGDDEEYEAILKKLIKGSNVMQVPNSGDRTATHHKYYSPATDAATLATEVLDKKIEHFFVSAFRQYSDSAKERTATEMKQDRSQGIEAFLSLLSDTLDEMENNVFYLVEQTYFPLTDVSGNTIERNRQNVGLANTQRSKDFSPMPEGEFVKQMKETVFGFDPVPSDVEAKFNAAKQILDFNGITYDEEALRAQIENGQIVGAQQDDIDNELDNIVNA